MSKRVLLRAATFLFLMIFSSLCIAGEKVYITSSGETLYYLNAVPSVINVTPTSLDFGTVNVGSTSSLSVTVKNTGAGDLDIGVITSPSAPFSKTIDNCSGQSLVQNASCIVAIQFTPVAEGTFNSSFTIPSNDPNTPSVNVTVTGKGEILKPIIVVTPTTLDFGSVNIGSSKTLTVTVQNTGDANLEFSSISNPAAPFSRLSGGCGSSLAPSASCTITIQFSPTSVGTFNSSFTIPSNDPNTPSVNITVTGKGEILEPIIVVTPTTLDFGPVSTHSSGTLTVTIRNTGNANLEFSSISNSTWPFRRFPEECGSSLAPSASCTIKVEFAPIYVGTFNSSFTIQSNASNSPSVTVSLTGSGTEGYRGSEYNCYSGTCVRVLLGRGQYLDFASCYLWCVCRGFTPCDVPYPY